MLIQRETNKVFLTICVHVYYVIHVHIIEPLLDILISYLACNLRGMLMRRMRVWEIVVTRKPLKLML